MVGGEEGRRARRKEITANFCKVPASTVTAQPSSSPVPQPRLSGGTEKSREEPGRRGHPAGVTFSVASSLPSRSKAAPAHLRAGQRGCRGRTRPWGRRKALCRSGGPAAGPPLAALHGERVRPPGWRQPVVNTAAPRLQHPHGDPSMLSLSAAPGSAERGGEAKQRGLGWSLSSGPRELLQGCPAVPSQAEAPQRQPQHLLIIALGLTLPSGQPIPSNSPHVLASPGAPQGSREKPWSYRSMMSAMVQANMRSPSGICRATGKRNSHGVRRGWKGHLEMGTSSRYSHKTLSTNQPGVGQKFGWLWQLGCRLSCLGCIHSPCAHTSSLSEPTDTAGLSCFPQ